jgi:phage gp16-like protein
VNTANDTRRRELAAIHIGAQQIGMDDDSYRDMLWAVARVRSAKDLDEAGRRRVLDHLRACGARFKAKGRTRPAEGKAALVGKIRAMLSAANRPDAYGDGMAKRMFHVERYEWLTEDQLRRVVAALNYDAKRIELVPDEVGS